MTAVEQPAPHPSPGPWRPPDGLQLLGRAQGSGLREPSYLVRRADGQVAQVSELLFLVLQEVRGSRTLDEVSAAVSARYGRDLTGDGLAHLVSTRLQPLGLVEAVDAPDELSAPRANPVLSLTLRGTLLPPSTVRLLARMLAPLYHPLPVVAAVTGVLVLDVVLLRRGNLLQALEGLLATPTLLLALFALLTLAAVIHEIGHAAACHYGGARPGGIGFGVYLVFPAFYTDVTDSYRLGRAGRVRTDLGGLYFNLWCLLVTGAAYLLTGHGLLLLVLLLLHVEMAQQLIPAVRFDGYWVLSDLAGVPDLFARVGPVLRSLVPGQPTDPRVTELKTRSRRLVVGWVVCVVPVLAFGLGWLTWNVPLIVGRTLEAIGTHGRLTITAWGDGDVTVLVLSALSAVLLVLPLLGLVVLFWRITTGLLGMLRRVRTHRSATAPEEAIDMSVEPEPVELTATAFTDERMLPAQRAAPTTGWQRAVYVASGRALNPGPGAGELRRQQREQRLRSPIEGTRRVVVMSRKGGVGKTTMTLALGSTFATLRGDRVIAVDANPDAGNLAHRVAPPVGRSITDVLHDIDCIHSYAELREYTSQAPESRLEVLASDDDPRIGMALDSTDYHRLIGLLDHYYNLILLDTGTGILDSANQGLLTEADELVLVSRPGLDGGRAAGLTLDWLDEHGYGELVTRAVVVINAARRGVGAPLEPMVEHFERRCSRVLTVPWDPALETGAQTVLSALRRDTREGLIEVAAAVADNFARSGARA